jgi:hypothetical protein
VKHELGSADLNINVKAHGAAEVTNVSGKVNSEALRMRRLGVDNSGSLR